MDLASWAACLAQSVQATAEDGPDSGYISPLAWKIIIALSGALVAAVTAMAFYIRKLHSKIEDAQESRVRDVQAELSLWKTMRREIEGPKGGGNP